MKILSFFLGPGSSLIYAAFGAMIFWAQIHYGINSLNWLFTMTVIGLVYTFLQMMQVVTLKAGGLKQGGLDIFMSLIPAGILLLGIFTGGGDVREWIIYGGFILLDMVLLVMTMRVFQMTTEVTGTT